MTLLWHGIVDQCCWMCPCVCVCVPVCVCVCVHWLNVVLGEGGGGWGRAMYLSESMMCVAMGRTDVPPPPIPRIVHIDSLVGWGGIGGD